MGIPFLVGALLAKKFITVGLYQSAKKYGFNRSYRRILEGIRLSNLPPDQACAVRSAIKQSMRFPSKAGEYLSQSAVVNFMTGNGVTILRGEKMPAYFGQIADLVTKPNLFGTSALDLLKKYSKK